MPSDPRLSPDGRRVVFTVLRSNPTSERYTSAVWLADSSGAERARQLTMGARRDHGARWSPDGRAIAFISDRRTLVEEEPGAAKDREDQAQAYLLPADGPGEARRLTDLPRGVERLEWSPDGRFLAVLSASRGATRAEDARARRKPDEPGPGEPPHSDYRYADRLHFLENGRGFAADKKRHVWIVDVETGEARRLTSLAAGVDSLAWSPDGSRLAIETGAAREFDLRYRPRVVVIDIATGRSTPVAEHPEGNYQAPAWLPDGRRVVVLGGLRPHVAYRSDVMVFPADGSDPRGGRDLTSRHDLMPGSAMNSDVTIGEEPRLLPTDDGSAVLVLAPRRGAVELWQVDVESGDLVRRTDGRHYLSAFDAVAVAGGTRVAAIVSSPTELPEVAVADLPSRPGRAASPRAISDLNRDLRDELELREAIERWVQVDGRQVQGWLIPAGPGRRPAVVEIHGGPHTLYGWSPFLEFQVLAGAGMSVVYANPRGSEGYGREFNEANRGDWGDGPMRDVLAVLDAFVADGLVDLDRLGVTGGSYGGYLTTWIIGHDQRFRAALTARSVSDLWHLMLVGDLGGTEWPTHEFGAWPMADPERFRRASPVTYAADIRTPLLIQHAERDLRTTIDQADLLFSVLRRLRRPVRLMRVPEESHELTRSGAPFRRVENLVQVRDWFAHFLVKGRRRLPPMPRSRFGS